MHPERTHVIAFSSSASQIDVCARAHKHTHTIAHCVNNNNIVRTFADPMRTCDRPVSWHRALRSAIGFKCGGRTSWYVASGIWLHVERRRRATVQVVRGPVNPPLSGDPFPRRVSSGRSVLL